MKESHPSYGLLSFHRVSSNKDQNLFGSSIKHRNTMRLTLSTAEKHRSLNYDSFFPTGQLFEIEMSPVQFAELITSANVGSGVPVTIKWTRGEGKTPECPAETKRLQFEEEFTSSVKKISETLTALSKEAMGILSQGSLKKEDRERVKGLIHMIEQDVRSNLPFINSMFNEQMDRTVQEAKGETEAFFRTIVEGLGIAHLAEEIANRLPALPDINETPKLP